MLSFVIDGNELTIITHGYKGPSPNYMVVILKKKNTIDC